MQWCVCTVPVQWHLARTSGCIMPFVLGRISLMIKKDQGTKRIGGVFTICINGSFSVNKYSCFHYCEAMFHLLDFPWYDHKSPLGSAVVAWKTSVCFTIPLSTSNPRPPYCLVVLFEKISISSTALFLLGQTGQNRVLLYFTLHYHYLPPIFIWLTSYSNIKSSPVCMTT